jgi:hypothetical protein
MWINAIRITGGNTDSVSDFNQVTVSDAEYPALK